jgi:hypothetical protein
MYPSSSTGMAATDGTRPVARAAANEFVARIIDQQRHRPLVQRISFGQSQALLPCLLTKLFHKTNNSHYVLPTDSWTKFRHDPPATFFTIMQNIIDSISLDGGTRMSQGADCFRLLRRKWGVFSARRLIRSRRTVRATCWAHCRP